MMMKFFRERGSLARNKVFRALGRALLGVSLMSCASAAPGTIGAALGQRGDRRLFIRAVPPGEGAARAGLQIDDEILAIDGRPVAPMAEEDVRRAVRGDVGSVLTLTIARKNEAGVLEKSEVKVTRTPLLADKPGGSAK